MPMLDKKIVQCVINSMRDENIFPTLGSHFAVFDEKDKAFHGNLLIRKIVEHFLRIRLFKLGKEFRAGTGVSSRHSLGKLILNNGD